MKLCILLIFSLLSAGEWRPLIVEATAYCPCKICCGVRAAGRTADGTRTNEYRYGVAVAFPKEIPYRTPIMIPTGNGYLDQQSPTERVWYCDDTGGRLKTEQEEKGITRIDLRFIQHGNAVRFGRRRMTIFIWVD